MNQIFLFDLDDTLITVNMDRFLPGYFGLLGSALSHLGTKEEIGCQINFAVEKMVANRNPTITLKEVFDQHFYSYFGTTETACKQTLDDFYRNDFSQLQPITNPRPEAKDIVDWSFSQQAAIAIATNPLFPQTATRQRIEWAGLDPDTFEFFTTYENFHFTKPHIEYYAEILGHLGWPDIPVIMVGDSIDMDLIPVKTMGYKTFWIHNHQKTGTWTEKGSLTNLKPWLKQILQDDSYQLADQSSVQISIIRSTAAIFDTWHRKIQSILHSFSASEQTKINQLVSAITNLEINLFQPIWKSFLSKSKVTSSEYTPKTPSSINPSFDQKKAIKRFIDARLSSLSNIEKLNNSGRFTELEYTHQNNKSFPRQWLRYMSDNDRKILHMLAPLLNKYKIF